MVRRHRRRTTFCISTGVHRLFAQVDVKPGDRFIGAPGAILNGSRLLTNWTQSGSFWVISVQTQQNIDTGQCDITHPLCNNENDVFFDGKPLAPASSLGAVGPGKSFSITRTTRSTLAATLRDTKLSVSSQDMHSRVAQPPVVRER
jgi:hypothetical protein